MQNLLRAGINCRARGNWMHVLSVIQEMMWSLIIQHLVLLPEIPYPIILFPFLEEVHRQNRMCMPSRCNCLRKADVSSTVKWYVRPATTRTAINGINCPY